MNSMVHPTICSAFEAEGTIVNLLPWGVYPTRTTRFKRGAVMRRELLQPVVAMNYEGELIETHHINLSQPPLVLVHIAFSSVRART